MDPPASSFKMPAAPATPLQQLSPDRMNQQRIPASPSLPNQLSSIDSKCSRQSIDVQSKVAFINSLNQAGSPSRQQASTSHAALQRALLGREEAETALRASNVQLAEADVRQRKISERVETLMEELQALRERQAHERQVFEKEVRKARKDAFRAGSGLVKVQEDLKESRAEAKNLRADVQREKHEKEKSKQEAFERAYTLAGLLEEVEMMRGKLQAVEAAREAEILEQQSRLAHQKEEEERILSESQSVEEGASVMRVSEHQQKEQAADTTLQIRHNRFERDQTVDMQPVPGSQTENAEQQLTGPARAVRQTLVDDAETGSSVLAAELGWEKQLRTRAEDMVHFLQMECQFKACACRRAEKDGKRFVHDREYDGLTAAESVTREEDSQDPEYENSVLRNPDASRQDMSQLEDDMFNISRQSHQGEAEPKLGQKSPKKIFLFPCSNAPSPDPSIASAASAHMDSSQLGQSVLSSIKNTSSPAICSAEDMTYQSPLRAMIRPKSVCSIPTRDMGPTTLSPSATAMADARSPPTSSPNHTSFHPGFQTPQRPGLRIVRSQTTTTMMVPLRSDDDNDDGARIDDVFSPQPSASVLRTPGTPVTREAALAQIRARRDRARSVAIRSTPRGRREESAGTPVAPGSRSRSRSRPGPGSGTGSARRGLAGGLMRDVSAPGRF